MWRTNVNAFIYTKIAHTKIYSDNYYYKVVAYSVTNGFSLIISYANDR